jgi:hypothetical protein
MRLVGIAIMLMAVNMVCRCQQPEEGKQNKSASRHHPNGTKGTHQPPQPAAGSATDTFKKTHPAKASELRNLEKRGKGEKRRQVKCKREK